MRQKFDCPKCDKEWWRCLQTVEVVRPVDGAHKFLQLLEVTEERMKNLGYYGLSRTEYFLFLVSISQKSALIETFYEDDMCPRFL
jgi:hypothetical protein